MIDWVSNKEESVISLITITVTERENKQEPRENNINRSIA